MEMNFVAKWLGGSHLYNLNTPASDIDDRGIFLSENVAEILGLSENSQKVVTNKEKDIHYWELSEFLAQLRNGSAQAVEFLFAPEDKLIITSPCVEEMRANRTKFIGGKTIHDKLSGFITSQQNRVWGDKRKPKEDGKVAEDLAKYGFSPKLALHAIRVAKMGTGFFETGEMNVTWETHWRDFFIQLKTEPEKVDKAGLKEVIDLALASFTLSWVKNSEFICDKYQYDAQFVEDFLLRQYYPILEARFKQL